MEPILAPKKKQFRYYNFILWLFQGSSMPNIRAKKNWGGKECFCMESVDIAYSRDSVTKERCNCSPKSKFIKPFKVKVYHKYCLLAIIWSYYHNIMISSLVCSSNWVPDCGMVGLCLIPGQTNTQGIYITKKKMPPLLW